MNDKFINKLLVGNALTKLKHLEDGSIDLIITSPPYWNAVVYDKDVNTDYESYLNLLTDIFSECSRILRPNGKMAINTPLMPIPQSLIKQDVRHLKDISSDLSEKILSNTDLNLFSVYVWQKQTSKLMFGSYPYPGNLLENKIQDSGHIIKDRRIVKDDTYAIQKTHLVIHIFIHILFFCFRK